MYIKHKPKKSLFYITGIKTTPNFKTHFRIKIYVFYTNKIAQINACTRLSKESFLVFDLSEINSIKCS